MKQLVIGIDGGTERILRHFDMPFTSGLLEKSAIKRPNEDVWSRGWAEMYTGLHAREPKAFYEMPALDGSHRFHRKFGWKDATGNPGVRFLWDALDQAGVRSLFMNIPTTFPAPPMKHGVFIAGAGGGLNDVSTIPDGLCSSEEARRLLEEMGYVVDLRYQPSGITELAVLFERLDEMMTRRAEGFVRLAKHYESEFGFLAFRATTIVQYVALSEIEMLIGGMDMPELGGPEESRERPIHAMLREHYRKLDAALELLFTELQPGSFILTADHGHVPFLKRANLNPVLSRLGYQQTSTAGRSLKKTVSRLLPTKLWLRLAKSAPRAIKEKSRGYAVGNSRAFAHENVHGIYVNDARRFGGPVAEGDVDGVVDELCRKFNEDPEVVANGMSATPYRRLHLDAHFADMLPDIWVDRPEEIFFDGDGGSFVEPNPNFAPILDLRDVPTDVNSGQKGRVPLFVCDRQLGARIDDLDPADLTVVYRAVCDAFGIGPQG